MSTEGKSSWLPGFQDFFFLVALYSLLSVQLIHFADDPGLGWHLKTGEYIAQSGSLPTIDPFLAAAIKRFWVADQWLADLLLFELYSSMSWPGLYFCFVLLFVSAFFLCLYPLLRILSAAPFAASAATLLAFKMAQIHFILRPTVLGIVIFALLYAQLQLVRAEKVSYWRMFPLILLLFVLWPNLHPSFVLGLLLLGLHCFSSLYSNQGLSIRQAIILLGACAAATVLNPYGLKLHESILLLGQSGFFMQLNEEWQHPSIVEYTGQLFLISFVILAIAYCVRRKTFSLFEIFSVLVFAWAAYDGERMLPYYAIVASFPMAKAFVVLGEALGPKEWPGLGFAVRKLESWERRSRCWTVLPVLVLFVFSLHYALSGKLFGFSGPYGPSDKYPYKELRHIVEHASKDSLVVYSTPNWGGFITWFGKERVRAVIDDRNVLLGEEIYRDYLKLENRAKFFSELSQLYPIDLALLKKDSQLAQRLQANDPERVLHQGEVAIIVGHSESLEP